MQGADMQNADMRGAHMEGAWVEGTSELVLPTGYVIGADNRVTKG
jgi:hypothetical protein